MQTGVRTAIRLKSNISEYPIWAPTNFNRRRFGAARVVGNHTIPRPVGPSPAVRIGRWPDNRQLPSYLEATLQYATRRRAIHAWPNQGRKLRWYYAAARPSP